MPEYIERESLYQFLTDQKDKEAGAYSKGRNAGLDVARSALHNREITPAADVVEVGACEGCYWKGLGRFQKCTYCRRNRNMKDHYMEGRKEK